jgi:hypothetical protein
MMKQSGQIVFEGHLGLLFVIALTGFNHRIIIPLAGVPGETGKFPV